MIIKKIISILLILLILLPVLSLFSCHKHQINSSFVMPEEFDTSKTYEITFWAKNESNLTQVEVYSQIIKDFEAIYPNIKVKIVHFTSYPDIYNQVITNIATNTTPNVCITYPDHIATYLEGENVVVPLDELISNDKYGLGGNVVKFDSTKVEEIIPEFLDEGKINGVQYALPFMRSTEACYINKDLIESLGFTIPDILTWEYIWEVSEYAMSLGKDENGNFIANNQMVLVPFTYKSTDNMMISMLKQLNAPYSTDDGKIEIFNDTTKSLLNEIAAHRKSKAFNTKDNSDGIYPADFLNRGQCIFAIDSTAGATWMGSNAPQLDIDSSEIVQFETVVRPIPQYDADNPQMISQGPSICIFNKRDNDEVLASWLFAQFLLTNQAQISYSQTEGYLPVTSKAHSSAEYQDYLSRAGENNDLYYDVKIESARMLLENISNTFTTPVFNGSASLRNAAGQLIELTVSSVDKGREINDAFFELLKSTVTSLYKLDQPQSNEDNNSLNTKKPELGELPIESKILLTTLCVIWIALGIYWVVSHVKSKKNVDFS